SRTSGRRRAVRGWRTRCGWQVAWVRAVGREWGPGRYRPNIYRTDTFVKRKAEGPARRVRCGEVGERLGRLLADDGAARPADRWDEGVAHATRRAGSVIDHDGGPAAGCRFDDADGDAARRLPPGEPLEVGRARAGRRVVDLLPGGEVLHRGAQRREDFLRDGARGRSVVGVRSVRGCERACGCAFRAVYAEELDELDIELVAAHAEQVVAADLVDLELR